MNDYSHLEKRLNYTFDNKQLIIEALTHKSHKKPYNNERLEFLGEKVILILSGLGSFFLIMVKTKDVLGCHA